MTNFRLKKDKKKVIKPHQIKDNSTLDKKHREKVKEFNINNNLKKKLQNQLKEIQTEINLIDSQKKYNNKSIERKKKLLILLDEIEIKLIEINNNNEMDYYNKAGDIICNYYLTRDQKEKPKKKKYKSIVECLNSKNKQEIVETNTRSKLFKKYCQITEGLRIDVDDGTNRIKYCKKCNIEKILDIGKSSYICTSCGKMEEIIFDEDNIIKEYSCYKRLSHFREWLTQFQAKESTDIDEDVYKKIIKEFKKLRITDPRVLNREKMQKILFKLGHSNLYEHIPYIINKLSNIPPPKISPEIEKKFYDMFILVQKPWEMFKPKGRKNIISYSFLLYKFCELLELDDLLQYFPLLKSNKKLMDYDIFWNKCCKFLKWEFYPTSL